MMVKQNGVWEFIASSGQFFTDVFVHFQGEWLIQGNQGNGQTQTFVKVAGVWERTRLFSVP